MGVALDTKNVTLFMHYPADVWAVALLLAAHLAAGVLAGMLYFRHLRQTTDKFAVGSGLAGIVWMAACRFIALGGILFLAAQEGALPLLFIAAGVMLGRFVMLRNPERGVP